METLYSVFIHLKSANFSHHAAFGNSVSFEKRAGRSR